MDPPFERAADVGVQLHMAPPQLVEHADHPDAGRGLQDRHDIGLPIELQGVGPSSAPGRLLLRGQARVALDPVGGGGREPGLRRSRLGGQCLSVAHVQPRLVVGDVEARQYVDPSFARQINNFAQPHPTARRVFKRAAGGAGPPVGLRPPFVPTPPAPSHPD